MMPVVAGDQVTVAASDDGMPKKNPATQKNHGANFAEHIIVLSPD
jgi:hypothetical protein